MGLIVTYSDLKAEMADWLAKSNLTHAIPGMIQNWEEKFYRQPKNFGRWMEISLNSAIVNSVIPVPGDYLGLKVAYVDGQRRPPLDRISLQNLYGRYPRGIDTSVPKFISRDGSNFVFGPQPDSNYTIKGVYWGKPLLLRNDAGDAADHWLIVNAPDLVLYGALIEAQPYLRSDARIPVWRDMYERSLKDYRDLHKEEDVSGSPMQEVLA